MKIDKYYRIASKL